jgi:hypothetical protein
MNDDLPTVAIDAKGYWWRVWGEDPMWSMVPANPDNSPVPAPVRFYRLVEVEGPNAACQDCKRVALCAERPGGHRLESGSHGYGCDDCGLSGAAGASWCRRGHRR